MKKKYSLLLKDILDTRNLQEASPELEIALESLIDGDPESVILGHIDNLCYEAFEMLPSIEEEKHLFRFAGFPIVSEDGKWYGSKCPLIGDIKNNQITLSSPNGFNDPMDPLIKEWVRLKKNRFRNKQKNGNLYQRIDKILDKIRICCLVDPSRNCETGINFFPHKRSKGKAIPSVEDCSPLMWAHYAKNHQGLCIEYRVDKSNLEDTDKRVIRLLNVEYNKGLPLNGDIPFTDSLVVKAQCWNYEKETRLLMYSRDNEAKYCQLPNFEIVSVYMGCRIGEEQSNYLKNMLKGSKIRLFQMEFSEDDISKLVAHEIKN